MKKHTFRTLVFVGIASIVAVACSKKNSTPIPINNLPQTLMVKTATTTNGYFSINTPNGFTVRVDDSSTYQTGSSGYIQSNIVSDSIKLNFLFGDKYDGPTTTLNLTTIKAKHQNDSVLNFTIQPINNFSSTAIVPFFYNKDNTDTEIELFALNTIKAVSKLKIYSQNGWKLKPKQLDLIKSMMMTVKYIP
ncbi:MAG TPA: hypothetical protein PK772_01770 [Chitinophagaceae bacterium]|nr:hypothetical protein [Chitinophagaceae bacterium]